MAAQAPEPVHQLLGPLHVGHRHRLGDLEAEQVRGHARLFDALLDEGREALAAKAVPRQVDGEPRRLGPGRHGGGQAERLGDDPAVELLHELVALGGRQELRRRDEPAGVVQQPHQHLVVGPAGRRPGGDDGLGHQRQPAAVDGAADVADQLDVVEPADDALVGGGVDLNPAAAALLGGLASHLGRWEAGLG